MAREIVKKQNSSWLFIIALVLSIVIFLFGMLLGNYIAMEQLNTFKQTEERLLVDLVALEIRDSVLKEDICSLSSKDLFEEKQNLGEMLTELERRMGKENQEVLAKKEIYELIEIKTLQNLESIKKECNQNFNTVIFFYTNQKGDERGSADGCEDQGKILDQVVWDHNHQEQGKRVYIFAFDINSQNQATKALMLKYNITSVPELIINGNSYGYSIKEQIEDVVK